MNQPDLQFPNQHRTRTEARALRDVGIATAEAHADREAPGWPERARDYALGYAMQHRTFTAEQLRAAAEAEGFPPPPDARAWGGALAWLSRRHKVQADGFVEAEGKQAHCAPKRRWRSLAAVALAIALALPVAAQDLAGADCPAATVDFTFLAYDGPVTVAGACLAAYTYTGGHLTVVAYDGQADGIFRNGFDSAEP